MPSPEKARDRLLSAIAEAVRFLVEERHHSPQDRAWVDDIGIELETAMAEHARECLES